MRIWDIPVSSLCRKHLLGEHRELHGLWNILTRHNGEGGYSKHPETLRWRGKLRALYDRHEVLVAEMNKRGFSHHSSLETALATGSEEQDEFIHTVTEQEGILRARSCDCCL